MIVADAGVLVEAALRRGQVGQRARERVTKETVHAPHLIDIEVLAAIRRLVYVGKVSAGEGQQAVRRLGRVDIIRHPHGPFLQRVWELRDSITPYDAVYVAMAERAEVTLLTLDHRLAAAHGPRCRIEVLSD